MKKPFCFLLIVLPFFALAQRQDIGSWNILNVKYSLNEKWSGFAEAQLRSLKFYNNFHYYESKGGINFHANKSLALTLGAGSYQTYKEGGNFVLPKNNNELRIWPQISFFQNLGPIKIEQRYRAELRFTSNGYRNRFRYRLGLSYPFGNTYKGYKPFQLSASNEIFFTNKEPYFERNRLLFAFNFRNTEWTTLQLGYLHQFDYKINDETGRDFLVLGLFFDLNGKKSSTKDAELNIHDN